MPDLVSNSEFIDFNFNFFVIVEDKLQHHSICPIETIRMKSQLAYGHDKIQLTPKGQAANDQFTQFTNSPIHQFT